MATFITLRAQPVVTNTRHGHTFVLDAPAHRRTFEAQPHVGGWLFRVDATGTFDFLVSARDVVAVAVRP